MQVEGRGSPADGAAGTLVSLGHASLQARPMMRVRGMKLTVRCRSLVVAAASLVRGLMYRSWGAGVLLFEPPLGPSRAVCSAACSSPSSGKNLQRAQDCQPQQNRSVQPTDLGTLHRSASIAARRAVGFTACSLSSAGITLLPELTMACREPHTALGEKNRAQGLKMLSPFISAWPTCGSSS